MSNEKEFFEPRVEEHSLYVFDKFIRIRFGTPITIPSPIEPNRWTEFPTVVSPGKVSLLDIYPFVKCKYGNLVRMLPVNEWVEEYYRRLGKIQVNVSDSTLTFLRKGKTYSPEKLFQCVINDGIRYGYHPTELVNAFAPHLRGIIVTYFESVLENPVKEEVIKLRHKYSTNPNKTKVGCHVGE